jgi:hypothetical protein
MKKIFERIKCIKKWKTINNVILLVVAGYFFKYGIIFNVNKYNITDSSLNSNQEFHSTNNQTQTTYVTAHKNDDQS